MKMGPPVETHATAYGKQLRRATLASVLTALILVAAKLLAWLWTDSISVLASLVDSLMDVIASSINFVAVRYSLMPADAEHRFGHGKAEPLAGMAQAGFICGSAVFLVIQAADRLRAPRDLRDIGVGVGVMVFAMAMTAGLLLVQRRAIERTQSTAIRADALHFATDLLSNFAVIVGLFLAAYGWGWADPVFAMAIAVYIFYSAVGIGHEAFQQLMDRELPADLQQQILAIARESPEVLGVHDIRTRRSGRLRFVQLHLELDRDLPLSRAHALADEVEDRILAIVPGAEIIIHQDPVPLADGARQEPGQAPSGTED
ncbi:MAG: cation diffusion facilitator family transporter [Polyangiales bacterium]